MMSQTFVQIFFPGLRKCTVVVKISFVNNIENTIEEEKRRFYDSIMVISGFPN